jgi:hypothetical protein
MFLPKNMELVDLYPPAEPNLIADAILLLSLDQRSTIKREKIT